MKKKFSLRTRDVFKLIYFVHLKSKICTKLFYHMTSNSNIPTARWRGCEKVMFSHSSVCTRGGLSKYTWATECVSEHTTHIYHTSPATLSPVTNPLQYVPHRIPCQTHTLSLAYHTPPAPSTATHIPLHHTLSQPSTRGNHRSEAGTYPEFEDS